MKTTKYFETICKHLKAHQFFTFRKKAKVRRKTFPVQNELENWNDNGVKIFLTEWWWLITMTLEKICSSRDSSSGSQSWIICELTSCKHIFTWAAKTSSSFYNSFHFLFSRQVVSVQSQNTIQNLEVWTTRRCATEEADTPAQNGGQAAALLWFRGILQALSPPGQRFLFLLLDLGGGAPPRHLACDKNWRRKKRQLAMKLLEVWTPDSIYNLSHYVYWLCEVQMHWTVDV